ncbi:hypothetical protein BXZ70DRAFT_519372 [Cristinia sonorae]|uniref:Uncharacterized protein n=1 Tax=Cristinia sonorae TaxID=1940300 RepID=A0A8K0UWB6_9AGAR|nr:hypothetical protein BXZ70DRAFT_519372 [Cristinia sonorae]
MLSECASSLSLSRTPTEARIAPSSHEAAIVVEPSSSPAASKYASPQPPHSEPLPPTSEIRLRFDLNVDRFTGDSALMFLHQLSTRVITIHIPLGEISSSSPFIATLGALDQPQPQTNVPPTLIRERSSKTSVPRHARESRQGLTPDSSNSLGLDNPQMAPVPSQMISPHLGTEQSNQSFTSRFSLSLSDAASREPPAGSSGRAHPAKSQATRRQVPRATGSPSATKLSEASDASSPFKQQPIRTWVDVNSQFGDNSTVKKSRTRTRKTNTSPKADGNQANRRTKKVGLQVPPPASPAVRSTEREQQLENELSPPRKLEPCPPPSLPPAAQALPQSRARGPLPRLRPVSSVRIQRPLPQRSLSMTTGARPRLPHQPETHPPTASSSSSVTSPTDSSQCSYPNARYYRGGDFGSTNNHHVAVRGGVASQNNLGVPLPVTASSFDPLRAVRPSYLGTQHPPPSITSSQFIQRQLESGRASGKSDYPGTPAVGPAGYNLKKRGRDEDEDEDEDEDGDEDEAGESDEDESLWSGVAKRPRMD